LYIPIESFGVFREGYPPYQSCLTWFLLTTQQHMINNVISVATLTLSAVIPQSWTM
jgi:hypothetical protein